MRITEEMVDFWQRTFCCILGRTPFQKFYITGSHFNIVTDHKPLPALRKLELENDLTGLRARWLIELDTFDFSIIHKDGKKHSNAERPYLAYQLQLMLLISNLADTPTPSSPLLREEPPP